MKYILMQKKTKIFENECNNIIQDIPTKERYNDIVNPKTLIGWFISRKFYNIRPGLCPFGYKGKEATLTPIKFDSYPIVQLFRNNKIIFICDDAIKVYEQHKNNKKCMMIMDPTYISIV